MENKEKYYNERVGFTSLGWLDVSPKNYRFMMEQMKENANKQSYFTLGSAIHCQVLEPEKFKERYAAIECSIPTGKKADAVRILASTRDYFSTPFDWHQNAIKKADLKGKIETLSEELINKEPYKSYLSSLIQLRGKEILDVDDAKTISRCYKNTISHKAANTLLYDNPFYTSNIKAYNEIKIDWKYPGYKGIIQSTIDRLIIDNSTKTIKIVDLKTTAKNVYDFEAAYKKYGYYRQAAIYMKSVLWLLNEKGYNINDYDIECYIVAVQSTGANECDVIKVSNNDLVQGVKEFEIQLERLTYHIENDLWEYPMEYYESDGIREVCIYE